MPSRWSCFIMCCLMMPFPSPMSAQLTRIDKCDPKKFTKKPHPAVNTSYLYCNTDGTLAKRDCPAGKQFNAELLECEQASVPLPPSDSQRQIMDAPPPHSEANEADRIIQQPQFQAPDDICTGGTPLTKLGAPVACNPSISSCPDGFLCTLHQRTGTSYCCQTAVDLLQESTLCSGNQVTYFEPLTGLPQTCALSAPSGCPTGFGCNLVGGSFTRCCGRDFGCPANSAGYLHPTTGSHVQCNSADPLSCPSGFLCTQSSMFNTGICCSDTSNAPIDICGGEAPLVQPNPCSASDPCPMGYGCRQGRCCPSKGVCPAGSPLGSMTQCSNERGNPCPNNFQCVTNNGHQYCCPSPGHVCGLPKDPGIPCQARGVPAVSRFFFDGSTGTCRSFQFSQCGGNANNFDSLEQCEGFCFETQCPQGGTGLRAGPALATCVPGDALSNAHDSCPSHYACTQPRFGSNFVCCSNPDEVCREPVSAGSACFSGFLTINRWSYNPDKTQCEAFQYYGCGGTGNNFLSKNDCENICQPSIRSACDGVAPLNDEGDYVQRCSENVNCPEGSWCNARGYCCPHQETACTSPRSIGHTCLSQKPGTFWYYDAPSASCLPFTYSGCGGSSNRFADREACERMCARRQNGECPRGMAPLLTPNGVKRCHPSQPRTCPEGSSCVQSSTGGDWFCCAADAKCPQERSAYVIPGSDSNVACLPDDDNCPLGFQCLQSSNVPGFYLCCSGIQGATNSRTGSFTAAVFNAVSSTAAKKRAMSALLADLSAARTAQLVRYAAAAPKCPNGLSSNGEQCVVNQIQACPVGYICIGTGSKGVCCKAQPKCAKKSRKPVFIAPRQVLTCGEEEAGCPEGSHCTRSSVSGLQICCMSRDEPSIGFVPSSSKSSSSSSSTNVPRHHSSYSSKLSGVPTVISKCLKDGTLPFFALGSRVPQQCTTERDDECPEEYECNIATDDNYYCCPAWDRCPPGASPFLVERSRKPLGCNWMANNCPDGYTCEGSKDRAICCRMRVNQLQCPNGRAPYLYGKRPLACPTGSKRSCPAGYECISSKNGPNQHLCCSTMEHHSPECVSGYAFVDSASGKNRICEPSAETCPIGYRCKRSTLANTHVCCSVALDNRYDGYCPTGQIPYAGNGPSAAADDFPAPLICHMALSPCPTNGPYQCVYSADKQNSYCCAPTAFSTGNVWPPLAVAAFPPKGTGWVYQQQQKAGEVMYPLDASSLALQEMQKNGQSFNNRITTAEGCGNGAEENIKSMAIGQQLQGVFQGQQQQPHQQQIYSTTYQQPKEQQQQFQVQHQQQMSSFPGSAQQTSETMMANVAGHSNNPYSAYGGGAAAYGSAAGTMANFSMIVASCPPWSRPLLDQNTGLGQPCSTWVRCPKGFTCYSNFPDGRNAHCCTTVPLDNQVVFRANSALAASLAEGLNQQIAAPSSAAAPFSAQFFPPKYDKTTPPIGTNDNGTLTVESVNATAGSNASGGTSVAAGNFAIDMSALRRWERCPPNMVNIGGMCKRMFFLGQPGCEMDSQCSAQTNGTHCVKGYCACPTPLLVHESKCVLQCPEGFLNIAGRCHDLTSVVFMDSVEQRDNGTIGGFCLSTVVVTEQWLEFFIFFQFSVGNSYCSEKSMTCQCRPGYELRIDDIGNRTEKGFCMAVEGSRFNGTGMLRDFVADDEESENYQKIVDAQPMASAFYEVAFSSPTTAAASSGEVENVTLIAIDAEDGIGIGIVSSTANDAQNKTMKAEGEGEQKTKSESENTTQ
uniref:Kunitz/Bovine pancreatic trypsin inhibitor domain protein n=1 Tax=Globodera rostochiensis TaxID=31243 RepID=A0A914I5B0_GLORO